jgi:YHS domain-containing protein
MSNFNWCHGPECHTKHTQDRVRGVKGSKVLRTRKIKANPQWGWYSYFCSQRCYDNFAHKHIDQIIAIAPRTEALETPILNPERKTHTYHYGFNNEHSYNRTETKIEVDETRTNDIG